MVPFSSFTTHCGKVTKKPDHMVSHLVMCRLKKALGGAAPNAEQAEARAAAGEQPAVRNRYSPHLGSQQYFGTVTNVVFAWAIIAIAASVLLHTRGGGAINRDIDPRRHLNS